MHTTTTNPEVGFRFIANRLGINIDRLMEAATNCPVRYPESHDKRLAVQGVPAEGALAETEGRILHALIVASGFQSIVELGTFLGHSTNYLASAAIITGGRVDTIDRVRMWGWKIRGSKIFWRHRGHVRQHFGDAREYLSVFPSDSVDFIFEDTDHSFRSTLNLIHISSRVLKPGGVLAIHDYFVSGVPSCKVAEAVRESGLDFLCIKALPGQQGLAIWRKP